MAAVKEYAYFIKGNKVAIVEKDTSFDNDVNSKDYGPGSNRIQWKSPLADAADGLEIEYTYAPNYVIKQTNTTIGTITHYRSNDGYLEIKGNSVNYDTTLDADNYIVLRKGDVFNGLHKIKGFANGDATSDIIQLYTKYSGSTSYSLFEESSPTLYYSIDVLNDETDELPITPYQERALICYVMAQRAMEQNNIELYEYHMKEFRKKMEKHNNARVRGIRSSFAGPHAIR